MKIKDLEAFVSGVVPVFQKSLAAQAVAFEKRIGQIEAKIAALPAPTPDPEPLPDDEMDTEMDEAA